MAENPNKPKVDYGEAAGTFVARSIFAKSPLSDPFQMDFDKKRGFYGRTGIPEVPVKEVPVDKQMDGLGLPPGVAGSLAANLPTETRTVMDPTDPGFLASVEAELERRDMPGASFGAPAIGPPTITYEEGFFPGTKDVAARTPNVMFLNKVDSIVTLEDVYDLEDERTIKKINGYTGIVTRDKKFLQFPEDSTFDERVAYANKNGAVSFFSQKGEDVDPYIVEIPYKNALATRLKLPSDFMSRQLRIPAKIPGTDIGVPPTVTDQELGFEYFTLTVPNYSEPDLRAAEAMRSLNAVMIQKSNEIPEFKDARTRLGIIDYTLATDPDASFYKIASEYGRSGMRFPLEFFPYAFAEGAQALVSTVTAGNVNIPDVGPFSSEWRQETLSEFIPRYRDELQDRLADNGIMISAPAADFLARYSMGLPSRAAGVVAEAMTSAGPSLAKNAFKSAREFDAYQMFRTAKLKKLGMPFGTVDEAEIINEFITLRSQGKLAVNMGDTLWYSLVVPMADKLQAKGYGITALKWARTGLVNRLNRGASISDVMNNSPEMRSGAQGIIALRDNAFDRRRRLVEKARNDGDRPFSLKEQEDYDKYTRQIEIASHDLLAEIASNHVPQFIRTALRQEKYLVIGGAVGGQLIQELGGDPEVGEMVGMFSGIAMYMAKGATNMGLRFVKKVNGSSPELDLATVMAEGINSFDPNVRDAIMVRVEFLQELQQKVVDSGDIDPSVTRLSIGQLTGLAVLQALDSTVRQSISARQIGQFGPQVQGLIDIQSESQQLLASMRKAYADMAEQAYPEGSAAANLQTMMKGAIEFIEADIAQRKQDLEVVVTSLAVKVERMISDTSGKATEMTDASRETIAAFDQTLEQLLDIGIQLSDGTKSEIQRLAKIRTDGVFTALATRAGVVTDELGDVSAGAKVINDIMPEGGLQVAGRKVELDGENLMPRLNTGGKLLSAWAEIAHGNAAIQASAGFRALESRPFLALIDGDFVPVGGNPKVDAGRVIDGLLGTLEIEDGVTLLSFATKKTISKPIASATVEAANESAEDFFYLISDDGEDVLETISSAVKAAKDDPGFADQLRTLNKLPGKKDALIAAKYQAHLVSVATEGKSTVSNVLIGFNQLRKMDAAFNELADKAAKAGNVQQAQRYRDLAKQTNRMFDEFGIQNDDGSLTPIDGLFIQENPEADPRAVGEVLGDAKVDWMNYKATWFNNPILSRWMGWGGREAKTPDGANPLGIIHPNRPQTWIKWDELDDDGVDELFEALEFAVGTPRAALGGDRKIDPNSESGKALVAVMEAHIGEWMQKKLKSGKINMNEIDEVLVRIRENFVGLDENNQKVELMPNIGKIIDDTRGYDPSTVEAKVYSEVEKAADGLIDRQKAEWKTIGNAYESDRKTLIETLRPFIPGKTSPTELIVALTNSGPELVKSVRDAIKQAKKADGTNFTDADIDVVLGDMVVQGIETLAFRPTGRFEVNTRNPSHLVPVFDFDVNVLGDLIGYGDPAKEKVIRAAVGNDRYDVAKAMFEFFQNKQNSPLGALNVRGIPRSFSVESYISRFYAINRDVIGPQYVATESILQRMRMRNFNMIQAALTDPRVGELFLEMVETGRPLPPKKEIEFASLLTAAFVKFENTIDRPGPTNLVMDTGLLPSIRGPEFRALTSPSFYDDNKFPIFPGSGAGEYYPEFAIETFRRNR